MERVPVRRKVIEYREERVIEEVPREVITTDYYAVESIKQYYKEIIPEKKIEMMPIERKVRRVEYVPVERYAGCDVGKLYTIRKGKEM